MRKEPWILLLLSLLGCRRAHQVGDHVLVDWRGGDYPAVTVAVEGPSKFHVHYDGFSEDWDEVIPATRIRSRLSTSPTPPSVYRVGDRVRVEWHGSIYPATILTILGDDRYRVHYEGFGNEWDEDIALSRIQRLLFNDTATTE